VRRIGFIYPVDFNRTSNAWMEYFGVIYETRIGFKSLKKQSNTGPILFYISPTISNIDFIY
jgi:hypothetical protein